MKLQKYTPCIVVLAMLGIALICIRNAPEVSMLRDPAVVYTLPDRVGEWIGEDLSYCQNESCMKAVPVSELSGSKVCPTCGGEMVLTWALSEKRLLPADTVLVRKLYRCASKSSMVVSMVISSSEEVSIHRPQMCLTGQGYEIAGEKTREIILNHQRLLRIRVLNLFRRWQGQGGRMVEVPGFYAYWFVSPRHETPSSAGRIFYATWDRVVHGQVFRWAYVSIAGERTVGSSGIDQQLESFLQDLYPKIMVKEIK
jgi:hypothetical protein